MTRGSSRTRQPLSRVNLTGFTMPTSGKNRNIYLSIKTFKNWLWPNFSCCPKNQSCPKFWGGCNRPPAPFRGPYANEAKQETHTLAPSTAFLIAFYGNQGWRSGESPRLPPVCPGSILGPGVISGLSLLLVLCSEKFFSGYSGFPLSSKSNISKFQFDPGIHGHSIYIFSSTFSTAIAAENSHQLVVRMSYTRLDQSNIRLNSHLIAHALNSAIRFGALKCDV